MTETKYNGETLASIEAFRRLYREQGHDVSWAKHPPSSLSLEFVGGLLELCGGADPLVYDVGGGEGNKTFRIFDIAKAMGCNLRMVVFDASQEAIRLGRERAEELGLTSRIEFKHANILDIDPGRLEKAVGVHEYQCINHVPRKHHETIAKTVADLVVPGGRFLTNAFNKNTTDFYGIDVSARDSRELVGEDNISGMYCYFYTEAELDQLYSPYFRIQEIKQVSHPDHSKVGRFHWELLATRK